MTPFKHILVPTDFADPAAEALELAIELARKLDAKLTLLHVYEVFVPIPYASATAWPFQQIEARAQALLDALAAKVSARHKNCQALLQPGIPSEQIVATAKDLEADLIVMGTHGRTGLPHVLMGSVAEKVVRTARAPVLTVRGKPAAKSGHAAA